MAFAFSNILLNNAPLSFSDGRLSVNGSGVAFLSEAAGGVTGLTVSSGDARYVQRFDATGGLKINTASGGLYDLNIVNSLDWNNRILKDGSAATSLNWSGKILSGNWSTNTNPSESGHLINKGYLDSITGDLGGGGSDYSVETTGNQEISGTKTFKTNLKVNLGGPDLYDASLGLFKSSDGYDSCSVENRILYAPLDWRISDPSESYIYTSISNNGVVSDYNSNSLDLAAGTLSLSSVVKINWTNNQLTGNWSTNTVPTLSGHILNKGYFDSVSGSLGGGAIPSDVVRTTGDQAINGLKQFNYIDATGINIDGGNIAIGNSLSLLDIGGGSWTFEGNFLNGTNGLIKTSAFDSEDRLLNGQWSSDGTPTSSEHITNKSYVDSTSSYTIPFGHASFNPVDSTTYYFGAAFGIVASSSQSTSPVSAVPKSGVLKSVIGTATVAGTLGSSETVSLVVYKNGTSVATGTYLASARNNAVSSGVNNLNIPVSELDTLQLSTVCPAWATNPTSVTQSFNAYITLA